MYAKIGDIIIEETSVGKDRQLIPEESFLEVILEDFQESRTFGSKKKKVKKTADSLEGRIYLTFQDEKVIFMTNRFSKDYFMLLRMDYIKMAAWVISSAINLW